MGNDTATHDMCATDERPTGDFRCYQTYTMTWLTRRGRVTGRRAASGSAAHASHSIQLLLPRVMRSPEGCLVCASDPSPLLAALCVAALSLLRLAKGFVWHRAKSSAGRARGTPLATSLTPSLTRGWRDPPKCPAARLYNCRRLERPQTNASPRSRVHWRGVRSCAQPAF